jgi:transcription elongation factor GreA
MITTATVIEDKNMDKSAMGVNSRARIRFVEDDEETIVTLVTTVDVDPENMCISIESDLGKALTGGSAGDVVEVAAPNGKYSVKILEIL